jgi:hypothetical protein
VFYNYSLLQCNVYKVIPKGTQKIVFYVKNNFLKLTVFLIVDFLALIGIAEIQ